MREDGRWAADWAGAEMTFGEDLGCTSPDFAALHPGYGSWEADLGWGGRAVCVVTHLSTFPEAVLAQLQEIAGDLNRSVVGAE
jgi:hypothetical protein